MASAPRHFEDLPAKREATPLLVGLVGASGSGKTFSALRLATGIQRVSGGDIFGIDTEARRMLHYSDDFKFRHLEFKAPFGSLDYLAAIEHCYAKGAKTIIVDSTSHEHDGPGGVLESHESEMERLSKGNEAKRGSFTFLAWQKPKAERRRMINTILQMPVNLIFCFRAKDKMKPKGGGASGNDPLKLGWMPIAGEEFVYEMTANVLLYPNGGGVPVWAPAESGEKVMIKLPRQFESIFVDGEPLSEDVGEKLARWAAGGVAPSVTPRPTEGLTLLEKKRAKILTARDKLGPEVFLRILGKHGATAIGEVTTVAQADAIIDQLRQTLEAQAAKEARGVISSA